MKRFYSLLLMCMLGLLSACGGGGGSDSPGDSALPEGVYQGTGFFPNASGTFLTVIEGDKIWTRYVYNTDEIGLIYGVGTASNGTITADNMIVYSLSPETGSLTGTVANSTFSGSTTFFPILNPGNPPTLGTQHEQDFSGTTPTGYDYDTQATLAAVAGNWSIYGSVSSALTTVNDAGAFSGNDNGCGFAGTITPHPNGKNIYQVAVTFQDVDADACIYPGSFTGVGVVLSEGGTPTAYIMGVSNDGGVAGAVLTAVAVTQN